MQKVLGHILAILGRIVFIGLSIQIVLGLLWMCGNYGSFQGFGDSLFYMEVSETLLFDEYTGALYPVILMLIRGIGNWFSIPPAYIMQPLQLLAAGWGSACFVRSLGVKGRLRTAWAALAIMTYPMVMQCHMAILPNSLTFTCFLVEMSLIIRGVRERKPLQAVTLAKAAGLWLLSALLLPEYQYLGAVPLLLFVVYDLWVFRKEKGRRVLYNLLLVAAFWGMLVSAQSLLQKEGAHGRPQKTWEAALFRRFVWNDLGAQYQNWPEEVKEGYSIYDLQEITYFPDNLERMLQPKVEAQMGAEWAKKWYLDTASLAFTRNARKILHEMAWDVVGYLAPNATLQLFLNGRGYDSFAGRNYEIMRQEVPLLTKYYANYSHWWILVGVAIALVSEVVLLFTGRRISIFPVLLCLVTAGEMIVWYVMQGAGIWDYKNALFAGALALFWMLLAWNRSVEKVVEAHGKEKDNEGRSGMA